MEEDYMDSAKFSNFAQRCKMAYWGKHSASSASYVPESYLDEILLIAWNDFKKFPQAVDNSLDK